MSRSMSAAMQAAIVADRVRCCYLVQIEFESLSLLLTSNPRDLFYNSNFWLGNGMLRRPSRVSETSEIRANGFTISVGGIDSATLALILGELYQTMDGFIYLALLDSSEAVIADPILIARGKFDTAEINEAAAGPEITLNYESDLIRRDRTNEFRYTDQAQQALFPGDLGFKYTDKIEDWSGFWGKAPKPRSAYRKRKIKNK